MPVKYLVRVEIVYEKIEIEFRNKDLIECR